MERENLLHDESLRMESFGILSDCFRLPEPGLSEKISLLESNLANVAEPAVLFVRKMLNVLEGNSEIDALRVEYSKLFVGPYKLLAAPYGSVYLEGERKIMGDSTLDVLKRYQEVGLETAKSFKDAPDHISAELEFMYYLVFKEVEAFSRSDVGQAIGFIQKQKFFLEDHLMAWVPEFIGSIIKHAENTFYPDLAKVTELVLKDSHQRVCDFLVQVQPEKAGAVDSNSLRI